jgi:hypothetical protein
MPRAPAGRVELLCTASLAHTVLPPDRLGTFLKTVLTCIANVGNAHLGNVREVSSSFEFETETLDDLLESSTGEQIMCTLLSPHMHLLQRHHSCLLAVSFC